MKYYTYLSVFSISVETCHRCCWKSVGDNDVSSKIGTSELSSTLVSKILGGPQGSFPLKYLNKTCIPIIYWLKQILKLSNRCFELEFAQYKWRKRLLRCKLWVRTVQKQSTPCQARNQSAAICYSYQSKRVQLNSSGSHETQNNSQKTKQNKVRKLQCTCWKQLQNSDTKEHCNPCLWVL